MTSITRPSSYIAVLHRYSVNRETSLSFGELPLTSCPGFRPRPVKDWLPLNSPIIQIPECSHTDAIRLLLSASSVIPGFLRFKAGCIIGFPLSCRFPGRHPLGLFPHRGRLLLHPEGLYLLKQTVLRHTFFLTVPVSLPAITDRKQPLPSGIPAEIN